MGDSYFEVGQKFQTFKDLEKAIIEYEKKTLCKLHKRDARKIDTRRINVKEPINPELIYHEIKYACIMGGKKFQTRSKGLRKTKTRRKDCPMYITIRLDRQKRALEVRSFSEEHNHVQLSQEYLQKLLLRHERHQQSKTQRKTTLEDALCVPMPISEQKDGQRDQKLPIIHTIYSILPNELTDKSHIETVNVIDNSLNETANDTGNSGDPSNIESFDSQGTNGDTLSTKKKKANFEDAVIRELKRTNELIIKKEKTSNELFGELIASKLDKLSEPACSQARIQILQILHDIEFGVNKFQIVEIL